MADKKFVVAIGGTGMRCLESFVHLCAIGMFDNEEIEILTLDTDQANGNKSRVEQLIALYNEVKSDTTHHIDGGNPTSKNFFSAKLNLHRFFTNYNDKDRDNYAKLAQLGTGTPETQRENQALSDLFLDKDSVQVFNLERGYRAQTHLGSYLMYHSIIETARRLRTGDDNVREEEKSFKEFLNKLSVYAASARVFVFGSVFGGTGASSIPVIPVAFRDAINTLDGISSINPKDVKFGATLLTEYFTTPKPSVAMKQREGVVADSTFFAINSQAALQFYQSDPTVMSTYRRLYHVGWPQQSKSLDPDGENAITKTGGDEQKNNCHVAELLCACAALDFFRAKDNELTNNDAVYLYKSAPVTGGAFSFSSADLVGSSMSKEFERKLGAFFSLSHMILGKQDGAHTHKGTASLVDRLNQQNVTDYKDMALEQMMQIDTYLSKFAYSIDASGLHLGWIYQVYNSVTAISSSANFIFKSDAFNQNNIQKVDPGEMYNDDNHNWDKPLLSNRYDSFIKKFAELQQTRPSEEQGSSVKEKLLAHLFNAIMIAQKYE